MRDSRKTRPTTTAVLLSAMMLFGGATCGDKSNGGETSAGEGEVAGGDDANGSRTNPDLGKDNGGESSMAKVALGPDGKPVPSGLVFEIGEGVREGGKKEPAPPAQAKPLPDEQAQVFSSSSGSSASTDSSPSSKSCSPQGSPCTSVTLINVPFATFLRVVKNGVDPHRTTSPRPLVTRASRAPAPSGTTRAGWPRRPPARGGRPRRARTRSGT